MTPTKKNSLREAWREAAAGFVAASLKAQPRLDFLEWAEKYLDNADGTRFRFRPYQRLVAKAMFSPEVQLVALRWASGTGKTYALGAGFLFGVHQMREQMAVMMPGFIAAKKWCKNEFVPLAEKCGVVASIGYAKNGDTQEEKVWRNGAQLSMVGANSGAGLRRLQAGVLYADEIDAITTEESDEGDKLNIFWMRGRGRKRVHKWASSYPSVKGQSKIDTLMEEGTLLRWLVDCAECGHRWEMHTDDIHVPNGETLEDTSLQCPGCKRLLSDAQRREMSENGAWYSGAGVPVPDPVPGKMSFHLNCMAHVGPFDSAYASYLHWVADKRREAEKSENPEKAKRVFVNTMDAESYEPPFEEKPDAALVFDRREEYDPDVMLPAGVLVVVIGADVQADRIELEYVGYGVNRETWGCGYKVLRGSPLDGGVWEAFDKAVKKKFDHPSGKRIGVSCTAIDSGHKQDQVLRFTRARRGVFGIKGAPELSSPVVARQKNGRLVAPHQPKVGTQQAKDIIRNRLALEPKPDGSFPEGFLHFPATDEYLDTYFDQLLSENGELELGKDGNFHVKYTCPDGVRNEALDCRVYAHWAYLAPRFNLKEVKSQLYGEKPEQTYPESGFVTQY